jgi:UDP-N-acetylmuramate--alanine ligase
MNNVQSEILKDIKNIHLIGIGGIGMSGIAEYLLRKGCKVSGSDVIPSFITGRLKQLGADIYDSHSRSNISSDTELVVYSSAVKNDNEEYKEAKNRNIALIRRAEMLGEIVNKMNLISVSGTHGKTTTTAMVAKILIDNEFDPTVFVGGNLDFIEGGSSRIGSSKYAVVEADEYDRSFLTLKSDKIIITNIEKDHTDIYDSLADIKNTFGEFCGNSKDNSVIIAYGDDENIRDVLSKNYSANINYFGFKGNNNFNISDLRFTGNTSQFRLNDFNLKLNIPGQHNVLNASASFIAGHLLDISPEKIISSLGSFAGVTRRLQLKYSNDIVIYDDYAHHPTEVKSSFEALKNSVKGRMITVFQPHLYTRTKDFYCEFADALKDNDIVILAKLYPARENEIQGVSSELILNELKKKSVSKVFYIDNFKDIINKLNEINKSGDTIVFQGAGNVTNLCDDFIKQLKIN